MVDKGFVGIVLSWEDGLLDEGPLLGEKMAEKFVFVWVLVPSIRNKLMTND